MRRIFSAVIPLVLISVAAFAQTHQLRDVTSGNCLTSALALKPCDGSSTQSWS